MSSSDMPGTPPPAHRRRNGWFLLAGVFLLILIFGGFGYLQLQRRLTQPLGPAPNFPTKEPTAVPVALILATATNPVDLSITPSASLATEIPPSPTSIPRRPLSPFAGSCGDVPAGHRSRRRYSISLRAGGCHSHSQGRFCYP